MEEYELVEKLEGWISEIRDILSLAEEVSQRSEEIFGTKFRIEDALKELKTRGCLEKKEGLQIDEAIPTWREMQGSGMLKEHEVRRELEPLLELLAKLLSGRTGHVLVETPDIPMTYESAARALADAKKKVQAGNPAEAVDRIHTAMHGYLKGLCDREGIVYKKDVRVSGCS